MYKAGEYGHKTRVLKLLFTLLGQPFRYTRKQLEEKFGVDKSTIERAFQDFRNVDLILEYDEKYRYGFVVNKPYKQLKDLLHFTEEDQQLLAAAIDKISPHSKRGERLKRKLASLYDYRKLGHYYLRRPYLQRMNKLEKAIAEKKQVVLVGYHSTNSNVISDRQVEPFQLDPPEDLVQCYDVDKRKLRYFRLSRFEDVKVLDTDFAFEKYHHPMPSDPFRIVDDNQVLVHIRMQVGAYNDLIEHFPLTSGYIMRDAEAPDWYDFQCRVNHQFIGIRRFLLANWDSVDILEPDNLVEQLNREVKRIQF